MRNHQQAAGEVGARLDRMDQGNRALHQWDRVEAEEGDQAARAVAVAEVAVVKVRPAELVGSQVEAAAAEAKAHPADRVAEA